MKTVIRESIFETNSSSTHSVTLKKYDKEGERCHFAVVSPFQKIVFLRALVANSEERYKYEKEAVEDRINRKREDAGYTQKHLRDELEKRVLANLEKNGFDADYFDPIDQESEGELFEFYEVWADESPEKEAFCALFESVWYEEHRALTLEFLSVAEEEYCKSKGIDKSGLEKEIDETPVRRCGRTYTSKFPVTCNRFFGEGALYDCDCGFGTYYEIANALCLSLGIDKYRWKAEENFTEKVKLFLSDEYCFACKEYYCGMGKKSELKPTDEIY